MNTSHNMTCIINATTKRYLAQGKRIDVIARYLRLKYKISIDLSVLKKRAEGDLLPNYM